MITYVYECQNEECGFIFEIEQSIKDKHRYKKCPACKKWKLERLIGSPMFFIRGDITTIGQLAEQNAKKMGKEGVASAKRKQKQEREQARQQRLDAIRKKLPSGAKLLDSNEHKPWYGKLSDKMQKHVSEGNNDKLMHYIHTGEEK